MGPMWPSWEPKSLQEGRGGGEGGGGREGGREGREGGGYTPLKEQQSQGNLLEDSSTCNRRWCEAGR